MSAHDPGEQPDRDAFAEMIRDRIRAAGESREIAYSPESFSLEARGEQISQSFLGNAYREYCRASSEGQKKIVRNFVRSWFAPVKGIPDEYPDAKPDLLPSVRARAMVEVTEMQMKMRSGEKFDRWPHAVIGDHLALSLAYDLPESIMSIQQHNLDEWGVSFEEAMPDAAENLLQLSPYQFVQPAPGVWRSPYRDNHDAARMVLLPVILAHPVEGDPVAMAPNRDTLLLTGSDDDAGLVALAEFAREAYDHPRALSGHALRLVEGEWRPWLPPQGHPAFATLKKLRLDSLAGDYASQKKALDAKHQEEGADIFVPHCMVATKEGEDPSSYAMWVESVDAMLPMADRVVFFRPREEGEGGDILGMVEWERVREVVGDLLVQVADLYPPRFRAREFPPEAMLAELIGE